MQGARQNLQQALAIVSKLRVEDPDNREFRALQARCLLLRLPSRDGPRRPRDPALAGQRKQGLDIFRDLVAKNPQADQLRYELCQALIADRRREGPGRGRRDEAPGRDEPPAEAAATSAEDLLALREAKAHADQLVKDQPLAQEYRALRGRVGSLLGRELRARSEAETDPVAMRKEAEVELRAALQFELELVAGGELADPRFVRQAVETGFALTLLHFAMGRRAEAVDAARSVVEVLEAQVALLDKRGSARPPTLLFWGPTDGGRGQRIEELLKTEQPDLAARLGALRDRLQPSDRGERPDRSPLEPRRGGK